MARARTGTTPPASATSAPQDLLERVKRELIAGAPEGWLRIVLKASMLSSVNEVVANAVFPDGHLPAVELPESFGRTLAELREAMYVPGRGTWFSVRCTVEPTGHERFTFNTDHEPPVFPDAEPDAWARDLERFGRDPEHVPDWLRLKAGIDGLALPAPSGPQEPAEVLQAIRDHIVHEWAPAWSWVQIQVRALGDMLVGSCIVMLERGGGLYGQPLTGELERLLRRLRVVTYQPGRGSWINLWYRIDYPGIDAVEYNLDQYGTNANPVVADPADCARELELFPRDAEHTPDWLLPGADRSVG